MVCDKKQSLGWHLDSTLVELEEMNKFSLESEAYWIAILSILFNIWLGMAWHSLVEELIRLLTGWQGFLGIWQNLEVLTFHWASPLTLYNPSFFLSPSAHFESLKGPSGTFSIGINHGMPLMPCQWCKYFIVSNHENIHICSQCIQLA